MCYVAYMRTVFITGANRGLGLELVKKFGSENWCVFAGCRDTTIFPKEYLDERVIVQQLDVGSAESQNQAIRALREKTTSLDVLINNAGLYDNASDGAPVFDLIDEITPIFQVNAIAPRLLSDKLVDLLNAGNTKLVITISSYMGAHSLIDEFSASHWPYSSSKAATNYAMDAFAFLNPQLKSLLIHPGWMKTRLGGDDAPYDPEIVAGRIFQLSIDSTKLVSGKLYDINQGTDGGEIGW
jgi:NAD(P)-dependent dehydrogenase (short-subunit alcohol dehydrogenase family)